MYDDKKILYWDYEISPLLIGLIEKAQREIIIVSPWVKMWTHLKEELEHAKKKGVQISLYYRLDEKEINIDELLPYFTHFIPIKNLHAKIYFIDDDVVVSSMNLYDYSQQSNKEIAILLKDQSHKDELRNYLDSRLKPFAVRIHRQTKQYEREKASSKQTTGDRSKTQVEPFKPVSGIGSLVQKAAEFLSSLQNQPGRCIRCGTSIEFDPFRPLCGDCYREWSKYENETYTENFCHDCGKKSKTSYAKPLCYECFKQS